MQSTRKRFLLYDMQQPALARLEGEQQLFPGRVRSANFFSDRFRQQRKGAASPADAPYTENQTQTAALLTFSEEPHDPVSTLYLFVGIDNARFKRVVEPARAVFRHVTE